jgi:hypothetical protein
MQIWLQRVESWRTVAGTRVSKARRVVYLSDHPALCLLETIVHVGREDELPDSYQLLSVDLTDDLIEQIEESLLSDGRRSDPTITQQIGNSWLSGGKTAGLLVPSVISRWRTIACSILLYPRLPVSGPKSWVDSPSMRDSSREERETHATVMRRNRPRLAPEKNCNTRFGGRPLGSGARALDQIAVR